MQNLMDKVFLYLSILQKQKMQMSLEKGKETIFHNSNEKRFLCADLVF
jgi:hypothetical protein